MKRIVVQFGGTGDLAQKKLYPAYEHLMGKGFDFTVLALGRRFKDRKEFVKAMVSPDASPEFLKNLEYLYYDMADPEATDPLRMYIQEVIEGTDEVELIYYMALQPSLYEEAIRQIQKIDSQLSCQCNLTKKIVVEKPFGFDLESAQRYNEILLKAFDDKEIYRVDHYLGKEFMQNLLILRFHNDIIRSIWDNRSIESIQIIFDETHGVDQRLGFYEQIGVVRDTIQNHIMQIITYLTMNEPATLSPEDIAVEKIKVLRSIAPVSEFHTGRYESLGANSGHVVDTPTYAALKLSVNTYFFADVPIYIRTGKMQADAKSLIYVKFRNTTGKVMHDDSIAENGVIITIHPELTIDISMNLKEPDTSWKSKPVRFRFNQAETFGANTPEAYEQIVKKILQGDKSLFPSMREITESWRIVTPMLEHERHMEVYPVRTLPRFASDLAKDNGFTWFD
ncbi:MAG: glucose-6-phosphate dehydrogenase [Spirochaetae bacterium HGW-Spirochaetae-4]|nr:MAG: glucose-6-phosphate dehydrogenase [Spirochaetes bacterium GWC2_52_13]OHD66683.1 MAG: glucose-6-phosphate dehydrogenase [Spirochaetes bacterium GWF2_52_7]PKL10880.1 MAG: glucose-6-phosphate dehydrogenase [Spirochaetae bacterium HGW-Spirochaetae-8]PKL22583.1 MAG: glucose-6-phosphate dehydrogenase [Spirochaetae bacterium HGW-Spirochaetae-4]HCG62706.1 glucose-6-phosphate dehydrogenase [Sphaerochaeta sp.]